MGLSYGRLALKAIGPGPASTGRALQFCCNLQSCCNMGNSNTRAACTNKVHRHRAPRAPRETACAVSSPSQGQRGSHRADVDPAHVRWRTGGILDAHGTPVLSHGNPVRSALDARDARAVPVIGPAAAPRPQCRAGPPLVARPARRQGFRSAHNCTESVTHGGCLPPPDPTL